MLAFANAAARDQALATATKHIGMTCYLQDIKKILTWDGTVWIDVTAPAVTGDFLPLTGGTLTGPLKVSYNYPDVSVDTTDATIQADYNWRRNNVLRWTFRMATAETGTGDTGSDLTLSSRTDAGTSKANVLKFTRSTGLGTVVGDPTANLGIATKQYIDNKMPAATAVIRVGVAGSAPAAGGLAEGSLYAGY